MQTHKPVLLATLALSASLLAQQKSQEELIKLRDEKLAKAVFTLADWHTDYDAVRAEAKKTGKLIFAYFTRSYAH
ncbi:MAG: hypothetical protein R3F56_06865 [Planctomycetota bacterium]